MRELNPNGFRFLVAGLVLAMLAGGLPARAEISAELDDTGAYRRMVLLANSSEKKLRIWAVQRGGKLRTVPLNPDGDVIADSWPAYVEDPTHDNFPYVVWSRFNGEDYDLVWSRWTDYGWSGVDWVEWNARAGDDLNPSLAVDANGRPYLAWWNSENGTGTVYMSIFLRSRWMAAYLVSDPGVNSSLPVIEILEDGRIQVTYETETGPVSKIILFNSPNTITDDIDPMEFLQDLGGVGSSY